MDLGLGGFGDRCARMGSVLLSSSQQLRPLSSHPTSGRGPREVEHAGELALSDRERAHGHLKLVGDVLGLGRERSLRAEQAIPPEVAGAVRSGQRGCALAGPSVVASRRWSCAHRPECRPSPLRSRSRGRGAAETNAQVLRLSSRMRRARAAASHSALDLRSGGDRSESSREVPGSLAPWPHPPAHPARLASVNRDHRVCRRGAGDAVASWR
jgi:hypothetical protein